MTFSLRKDDTELITILNALPERVRSVVIRQCLAAALLPGGHQDVLDAIHALESRIAQGAIKAAVTPPSPSDPADDADPPSMADQWDQALARFDLD
jgi:hypothetical protein